MSLIGVVAVAVGVWAGLKYRATGANSGALVSSTVGHKPTLGAGQPAPSRSPATSPLSSVGALGGALGGAVSDAARIASVSPSASPSASPSVPASAAASSPAAGDPPVDVLNNSRISGLAKTAAQQLAASGWQVSHVGNYSAAILPTTTLYYADGDQAAAARLAQAFGISAVRAAPSELANTPLTLVLTHEWAQAHPAGG